MQVAACVRRFWSMSLVDALDLLGREPGGRRHFGRRHAVVRAVEAEVHLVVGQREVELFLRLRQRERVGGRRPAADLLGHAEVLGQRVDLGLVEVRDRLDVGGAVALLHEEALVVLEPVGRAGDGVVAGGRRGSTPSSCGRAA